MKWNRNFAMLCITASVCCPQNSAPDGNPPDLGLTAIGRHHHPIQTRSALAQEYFDQGITLIYGFNHEEAARAFAKAAELDPVSPMPLWGIALAVGPNYNSNVDAEREKIAYETITRASKLAETSSAVERDYVKALASRFSNDANADYKQLALTYADAMRALSQKYPDDLDAATLFAESLMDLNPWKLWSLDGVPDRNTETIVRTLESVLTREPMHVGANHYYIHAMEASPAPERALPSANRLETMTPKAGHLIYMPAHIYARVGNFSQAAESNVKAIQADAAYAKAAEQSGSMYDLMYHSHNEHFLAYAATMEGRYAEAKSAAEAMEKRLLPHAQMMPVLEVFLWTPIWVDLRFAKWDSILARPEPLADRAVSHLMWRYSRTLAYLAHKDIAKAQSERELFSKEASTLPPHAAFAEMNPAAAVLSVANEVIAARLEEAHGNAYAAILHWKAAVAAQDKLNYDEPPDWYYPVRESLGAALLRDRKFKEAQTVFREDLKRNPRNPRSLFGLTRSLTAEHEETNAAWVERAFREAWKNADVELHLEDL
jgi:tetratricopeptide (TPR) repeat protein